MMRTKQSVFVVLAMILLLMGNSALATRVSKIAETKHNLSTSGQHREADNALYANAVKSTTESEICAFCHTPHNPDAGNTPLWNKTLAAKTYVPYTSNSLDAQITQTSSRQPLGSSKLCLSCHDGAMALGSVRVLRGISYSAEAEVISVNNSTATKMPTGQIPSQTPGGAAGAATGVTTGYTRNLGGTTNLDLTNDHPISITYDSTLAARDGEMRTPDGNQQWGTVFGRRGIVNGTKYRPTLPLEPTGDSSAGQVQCTTCHDPHIKETDLTAEHNIKFLRGNRFQKAQPTNAYSSTNDIICLACHDKGMQGDGNTWAYSVHANNQVATQTYRSGTGSSGETREFPANIPVWKAACLNCHDTHTVTGSRRLLREGTDATPGSALSAGGFKAGGSSALEETCYQCHRDAAGSILSSSTGVPNIRDDFNITNGYRMPITATDQDAGTEKHDIGGNFNDGYPGGTGTTGSDCSGTSNKCGADFVESRALLGTTATNRHVECTDCHNPHRVVKFNVFYGAAGALNGAPAATATHKHTDTTGYKHTNVASGVLRGIWGVEPIYTSESFMNGPTNYTVRRGDPGSATVADDPAALTTGLNNATMDTHAFVTREYQVCMKCHSSYGYGATPPDLRLSASRKGLTASGTNGLTKYTDQAREFQAPDSHADEPLDKGDVAGAVGYITNNHRSWHPVMRSTGRTATKRNLSVNNWSNPWRNVGYQTMYCSDCHGSGTGTGTAIPNTGRPWGPHGSENPFILKGAWDTSTGSGQESTGLCFKCHSYTLYATRGGGSSGFGGSKDSNLHSYHADKIGKMRCNWCHVAVPHGWKNKALLVNLNDVGAEVGLAGGTQVRNGTTAVYNRPPYYMNAINKVKTFAASGSWSEGSCGSKGAPGNGSSGRSWMRDSSENCTNPP
ncbi:MAG TPA: hypothetical protein VJ001_10885 [Rhodocyclaceae bacterium]|nr:hypothetical protein [Rhodocyclaceae bacterium]